MKDEGAPSFPKHIPCPRYFMQGAMFGGFLSGFVGVISF